MNFGATIKTLRKELKLSQIEFSQKLNMTQTAVSLIESQNRIPHVSTLKKMCEIFNIPISFMYVMSFEEEDVSSTKKKEFEIIAPIIKSLVLQYVTKQK